jgi:hypothetical protein
LVILASVLPASAEARVVIGGGEARLTLDRELAQELRRDGVDIVGIGKGESAGGRQIAFPVGAGATNGAAGRGALNVEGGFAFVTGIHAAHVGDILVNTGKGQSTARIAGEHRILARHGPLRASAAGFGTRIQIPTLRLTGGTAAALNRKLHLRGVFRAGRRLGSLAIVAIPATVPIQFGTVSIGGPETTFSKLASMDVSMGLWGGSERWGEGSPPTFLFPVEPTAVAPDATEGLVAGGANDGISFQIESPPPRNMLLRGPRIDLASGELSATVSALSTAEPETATIATLDYSGATFQIRPKVGAFELMGIRAVASQFIADQLNSRFGTPGRFQAGETFARVSATLYAPPPG